MKRLTISITAFVVFALTGIAVADLTVKDSVGATQTMFDFLCFTTKHCSTAVPITSAGVEIQPATSAQMTSLISAVTGPIPVGTNNIGVTSPSPVAASACTPYHLSGGTAASNNAQFIKNAAGVVCEFTTINTTATTYYLKLYDLAAAPTCSSATGLKHVYPILSSGGLQRSLNFGENYATGIAFCVTGGGGDTDNSNASTGVYIEASYK